MSTESGEEVFALTISPASPFKSRDRDRAEQGMLNGKQVQWYRGELPSSPELLIRETLIQLRQERVVHIVVRTTDAETLAKYQQLVLSLPFPLYKDD